MEGKMLREWNQLPKAMRTKEVWPYYERLQKKKISLLLKRGFDLVFASVLLLLLAVPMLIISILIAGDSKGGIFFRQKRVTQYGKCFRIFKFRTMVANADRTGSQVTVSNDSRITRVGAVLRKYRLDELPQLFNILTGDMTFVGTRPESLYFVRNYQPEMMATLLLPAGVTSEASIRYKDEAELLDQAGEADQSYIERVLPAKMAYNLESLRKFSLVRELFTILRTVVAVIR